MSEAPPHNIEAERGLLGAMLLSRDAREAALAILGPGDLYAPAHQATFDALGAMHRAGSPVDPVTVHAHLADGGAGLGLADLTEWLADSPPPSSAATYAGIVSDCADRRRLLAGAYDLARAARDGTDPAAILAQLAQPGRRTAATTDRTVPGDLFALDIEPAPPAMWGEADQVLWARGESLFICGPAGVGKTTIAQQLTFTRIGLGSAVLGYPVQQTERGLYIAADRPAQAARSMARMVTETDRPTLSERLVVHRGPLPFDIGAEPGRLLQFAREHGADFVVIDSLKDVAMDLVKDDVGCRVNAALQECLAGGIEILALHHQRKETNGGTKPRKLPDVYGSTWLTAGAGSVIVLWGDAGDPLIELTHLKQPAEPVGPLEIIHDHAAGVSRVEQSPDAWTVLQGSARGVTAGGLAIILTKSQTPPRGEIEKARRALERLVRSGRAHRRDGQKGGAGGGAAAIYYPVSDRPGIA